MARNAKNERSLGRGNLARQARVGIVANPVELQVKHLPPRESWTKWPRLRSARRIESVHQHSAPNILEQDPILSGAKLDEFIRKLRRNEQVDATALMHSKNGQSCSTKVDEEMLPPAARPRTVTFLIYALLGVIIVLFAATFLRP